MFVSHLQLKVPAFIGRCTTRKEARGQAPDTIPTSKAHTVLPHLCCHRLSVLSEAVNVVHSTPPRPPPHSCQGIHLLQKSQATH